MKVDHDDLRPVLMPLNPRLPPPPPPRPPQGPHTLSPGEVIPFTAMMSPPPPTDISGASGITFNANLEILMYLLCQMNSNEDTFTVTSTSVHHACDFELALKNGHRYLCSTANCEILAPAAAPARLPVRSAARVVRVVQERRRGESAGAGERAERQRQGHHGQGWVHHQSSLSDSKLDLGNISSNMSIFCN